MSSITRGLIFRLLTHRACRATMRQLQRKGALPYSVLFIEPIIFTNTMLPFCSIQSVPEPERWRDPAPRSGAGATLLHNPCRRPPGVLQSAVYELFLRFDPALRRHPPPFGASIRTLKDPGYENKRYEPEQQPCLFITTDSGPPLHIPAHAPGEQDRRGDDPAFLP